MYVVVIAVLSIVLALPTPPFNWLVRPYEVYLAAVIATLVPPLVAWGFARLAVRRLDAEPEDPARGQSLLSWGMSITQTVLAMLHTTLLTCTQWMPLCSTVPLVGRWPTVAGLLASGPFLLSIVLVWIVIYPADRAVRQIALEVYLFRGKPVRPVWPFLQYLVYNLRHQVLFILIPMALILLARDVIDRYDARLDRFGMHGFMSDFLLGAAAVIVALIAPEILRHVWVTQRLPEGPLRDRLLLMCRALRLRCREILVWRTGGMIVNAAVMGLVAPLRYVLITDGMLEQMDERKIEAVFGHEAGHVKRHHILFFLLFALISGCLMTVVSVWTRAPGLDRFQEQLLIAIAGAILLLKWGFVFGWVSRRFERQADIFAVRTLAATGLPCAQPCALHAVPNDAAVALADDRLCTSAAHVFGDTLLQVAALNGIPPDASSWRHGSIESRERMIHRLAADPAATGRFERYLFRVKAAIFIAAAASAGWAGWELRIWTLFGIG